MNTTPAGEAGPPDDTLSPAEAAAFMAELITLWHGRSDMDSLNNLGDMGDIGDTFKESAATPPATEFTGSEAEDMNQAPTLILGALVIARHVATNEPVQAVVAQHGLELNLTRNAIIESFTAFAPPTAEDPPISELEVDVARQLAFGMIMADSAAVGPVMTAQMAIQQYFDEHPLRHA